jgi:phosphate starvation-inducible PhoH-like protein
MSAKSRSASVGSVKKKMKSAMLLYQPFEWTEKQKELIDVMVDYHTNAVFVEGPAGTGKSVCAMYSALELLTHNKIEKIVYIRSVVESSQAHLGYLPGDKSAKVSEWFQTAFEACSNFVTQQELESLEKEGRIEFAPISFLRGRNFKNCVIIVEECQNISYKEHLTILTRCADNCRIFLMGDSYQTDIKEKDQFKKVYEKLMGEDSVEHNIHVRFFSAEDIKRSELVKFLVEKLDIYKKPA